MPTLLLTHTDCIEHATPEGHPERPDRLRALMKVLEDEAFAGIMREDAPLGDIEHIAKAHPADYIAYIEGAQPESGVEPLDPDTWMSPGSWNAALRAVGAGVRAVDAVMEGEADNAFCAVRPPGHHAETHRAMGFCLFNSVAVAAHYARDAYGLERVAVVDFDVHHGNGTQEIFWSDEDLFYGSTHQMPLFPGTGSRSETGVGNIFNAPLSAGGEGDMFREAMETVVLPSLENFSPELLIISAGFDAHHRDPLASMNLTEEDFAWATLRMMEIADEQCEGRIVSMLEGGYDLQGLCASCAVHVQALMHGGTLGA
jgi:acetoin utilization deacetylase AcuC-like enzyme